MHSVTRRSRWISVCLVALQLGREVGAQSVSAGSAIPPTVSSSTGVTVWTHSREAFDRARRVRLDPVPLMTIGGELPEPYDLTYAGDGFLLRDGRVVILLNIGARVLVFDPQGRPEHAFGGEGRGPKELMRFGGAALLPDEKLLIVDDGNSRVAWVDPGKGITKTKNLDASLQNGGAGTFGRVCGVMRDGRVLSWDGNRIPYFQPGTVPDTIFRPPASLALLDVSAGRPVRIAQVPGFEMVLQATNFRGKAGTHTTVPGYGRFVEPIVWDTLIATDGSAGYTVDFRNADGKVVARLVGGLPRQPVTAAMREAYVARMLERYGTKTIDNKESQRLIRATPFRDSLPPLAGFFVTHDKTLWVVDGVGDEGHGWSATAFGQNGAMIGRLRFVGKGFPRAFGDDRVLLREEDEDGVVTFKVYRLIFE